MAIPASYMRTAVDIMRHGDMSVPEYMIWLQKADFTDCPRVTIVYGSDETLYACAPSFEKVMKKYGVDYCTIHVHSAKRQVFTVFSAYLCFFCSDFNETVQKDYRNDKGTKNFIFF